MAGLEINNSWQEEYIYLGSRLFAKYQSGGAVFVHPNALGSVGTLTNNSGQPVQIETEYPWGQQWKLAGPILNEQFAGMQERDEETGNDPTPNRMYASSLGRWLSPDPAGRKAVSLTDPQTWNLYAYAGDNPTSRTDPTGLCWNWLFPSCAKVQWGEHRQGEGGKKGWWESLWDGKRPQNQSQEQGQQDQPSQPSAEQPQQQKPPSWDPSKPLPDDPSKLGPDWKRDPQHKAPNDERYVNDKGDKIDWHKGQPGEKGWRGRDHWHWVPGGERQDQHFKPGDTVRTAVQVGAWGAAAAITVRVIITLGEDAALVF